MGLPGVEQVLIEIILDAKQANITLKGMLGNVTTLEAKIKQIAQTSGASFNQVGIALKQMYAQQLKNVGVTKQNAIELNKAFGANVNQAVKNLNNEMKQSEKTGQGLNQVLRLIRGTLVAIGVFRVFQFVEESMLKAIETAKEYETSLFRIANVERILSQGGIETSVEGLRQVILNVKKELPIFSEADITQQVSLIGIMTKEFGLTEKQIEDVAKAIGVLNIRSGETEDLLTTTNKVLTALVAPSGRGIASLGLDFSEANLRAAALRNNLIEAEKDFKKLTDHDKDMLKVAILLESTGQELETVQKFLETNTGALAEQSAEWEDTLRIAGQGLLALKASLAPFVISFLNFLQDGINGGKAFIIIFQAVKDAIVAAGAALSLLLTNPKDFISNFDTIKQSISDIFTGALEDGFDKFFSGVIPDDAPQWFKDLFEPFVDELDTPTDNVEKFGDALEDITELEGFDDLAEDLEKLGQRVRDLNEDFAISQARAFQDYQIDIQRIVQDFAIRRSRIIEDANQKITDANRKYHNRQIDDEAKFQEQLRQLREKFLFNLEDALRERDARQVLRLQRQYQMDKTALENEHALRQQEQARQHQEDLARIRQERDDRLAELAEEEQIKLQREREDYELKKQREEQDHQRDLEDLKQQINDRLMEFARAVGEEYDLNEQSVQALYELLQQYYGPQGYFDGLYEYAYDSMVARAEQMVAEVNRIISQAQSLARSATQANNPIVRSAFLGVQGQSGIIPSVGSQAAGGTFFANRPTHAIFGDTPGGEIASFIPVNKLKAGIGAGVAAGMGGGMNGTIELEMLLSPDLEARVVRNSMQGVSDVVARVRRTKV